MTGDITWRGGSLRGASGTPPAIGGTVTGSIYCPGNNIYIQNGIKMLGAEIRRGSSGGNVIADGGPLNLKAKIVNFTGLHTYRQNGLITFLAENLLPDTCEIAFGVSYASDGRIDLNGFSQRCTCVRDNTSGTSTMTPAGTTINSSSGPATLTILKQTADRNFGGTLVGHVSLSYESTSAYTLTLTGGVHTTDGALRVKSGKLRLGPAAAFSNLAELEVSGTGALTVENSGLNPGVLNLTLADDGALTLAEGVSLQVNRLSVDGAYLAPGSYTADSSALSGKVKGEGTISVLNGAPVVAGEKFVWTGAGANDNFTTPENWEGGVAPAFDGTEKLVLGGGSHTATVNCEAKVYGITVADGESFTINAAESAKIVMGAGGFTFTNTSESAQLLHSLRAPVELGALPQDWMVAANTALETTKPWTGRAGGVSAALTIHSFGRVNFWADNPDLETVLVLTNCTTAASQPFVYRSYGLGSPNRETWVVGCLPRFCTSFLTITNKVPLHIDNRVTNAGHGYFNDDGTTNELYFDAPITYYCSNGGSETYFYKGVHFRAPVTVLNTFITFRMAGLQGWLEGEGIDAKGTFAIDYGGTFNIASTNNHWELFNPYKCTVKFYATNALPAGKPVRMSDGGQWYRGNAILDLNGYDQNVSRMYSALTLDVYASLAAYVKSELPAVLTIQTTESNDDMGPFCFMGKASLVYDAPGTWSMTNWVSTTEGFLQVKQGTVKICKGAGWTAVTNVVLSGGTIAVAPNAGVNAFGSGQGKSAANLVYESGTMDVAEGECATVRSVAYTLNGHVRALQPGVYWAADAAQSVPAANRLSWLTGKGSLCVLRSAIPTGIVLYFR